MKKFLFLIPVLILLSTALQAQEKAEIQWVTLDELDGLQKKEPRKIIVDVYTTWCGPCKQMSKFTFTDPKIINYINTHFYAVKFDAESTKEVNFASKKFKNLNRMHEFAIYFGIKAYPTQLFFDTSNTAITALEGYYTAPELLVVLKYIQEDMFKKMSFEQYKASVK